MTDCIRYGIDGLVPANTIEDGCCPPDICNIDPCSFVCSFLNYLPSGPMWDRAKELALSQLNDPCVNNCYLETCVTMVNHARYTAFRLLEAIKGPLYDAVMESNPYTAYHTKELWLKRLNWVNCFENSCRLPELGHLTPMEILCLRRICFDTYSGLQMTGMGGGYGVAPTYVPIDFGEELTGAVQRGIIYALSRLQLNPIPTIDSINFAIQELGAEITLVSAENFEDASIVCDYFPTCKDCNKDLGGIAQMGTCQARYPKIELSICNTTTQLRKSVPNVCGGIQQTPIGSKTSACSLLECEFVNAWYEPPCEENGKRPEKIWPGLLAAECIVRYYLPRTINYRLTRCCNDR